MSYKERYINEFQDKFLTIDKLGGIKEYIEEYNNSVGLSDELNVTVRYSEYGHPYIFLIGGVDWKKSHKTINVDSFFIRNFVDELYLWEMKGVEFNECHYKCFCDVIHEVYFQATKDLNVIERTIKINSNLSNIEHGKRPAEKKKKESKKTKTYLMKDTNNSGFYKIGKSTKPEYREGTLQSEKPSIKLVKVFDSDIEKDLHKAYSQYRIRGEWFKLTKIQVKYICTNY